jgi:class 3 adenylate cyclase
LEREIAMLEPSLKNDLVELITANFKINEINELGKLISKNYDNHALTGTAHHVTVSTRKGAQALVDYYDKKKELFLLLKLIIEVDGNRLNGKKIELKDLELFLNKLARTGVIYDFKNRRIIEKVKNKNELVNWGSLRDGRKYSITVMSVDIVGNSQLVKKNGNRTMEKVYFQLWSFLKEKLSAYDGRMWSWAGDGGIIAFTFKDHAAKAVRCALEIQSSLPLFNARPESPIKEFLELRTALDTGTIKFFSNTGEIVSDVINYAAHLEKQHTETGKVSISEDVRKHLSQPLKNIFTSTGKFEAKKTYATKVRLDTLLNPEAISAAVPQ